jgi:putative membrane-bound dehydrogenase-like protein
MMKHSRFSCMAAAAMVGGLIHSGLAAERRDPLPPPEALASFRLEPGLRIELVAAEPLVVDPVAFAFDEDRRLYVVENRGYPDPLAGGKPTTEGRIALLEDVDRDGRYERRTEFATGLGYPNGITVWRGGVFVTCSPDILYLKDNNGDGVADERRVVLTGFHATKTAQIRMSHPTLGLDGWIYVTAGRNGGEVTAPDHPERPPVVFTANDGRFDPVTATFETVGGNSQFGLAFDAYGRRFGCANRHPVLHSVLEPAVLKRNPHHAFSDSVQEVSRVQHLAKVFPISEAHVTTHWAERFRPKMDRISHAGTFTSACGLTIFNGAGLGPEHVGNAFICEPGHNLVQRQVLRPEGASFRSEPPYTGREFLASTDTWFRPVFLGSGPDGALYVADMHRREIDHPQYVPEEARTTLDFAGGKGAGRIYRVVKEGRALTDAPARTSAELCRDLESPDAWRRERAHRLLIERADAAVVPELERCARQGALPEGRVRALWTLQVLKRLSEDTLRHALRDAVTEVRENAVKLAGIRLGQMPALLPAILAVAEDASARVRFEAALALAPVADPRVVRALAGIAARDGQDRWARAAVLSGIGDRMVEFFAALRESRATNAAAFAVVLEDLGRVFGRGAAPKACRDFLIDALRSDRDLEWCLPAVLGLTEGLGKRGNKNERNVWAVLFGSEGVAGDVSRDEFIGRLGRLAANDDLPVPRRASALAMLGHARFEEARGVLEAILAPRQPLELQLQAIRTIEQLGDPRGGELLVEPERWSRHTPQLRAAVIAALGSKRPLIPVLLAAIEQGRITPSAVPPLRRAQLLKHADAELRQAAERAFRSVEQTDRMDVYRAYRGVLALPSDAARGAAVFTRTCATCHTYGDTGGTVGPDLTGVRNHSPEALLLHIVVPNHEISPGYEAVTVTLRDGRTLTGWVAAEAENALTLRTAFGTHESIARADASAIAVSGTSLMPDGLDQSMTKQEMADLIAYLRAGPAAPRPNGPAAK